MVYYKGYTKGGFLHMYSECISIVMAVYNAEKTLPRCLDSLLAQSYDNFELICVDDGSKDASLSICNEYALRDSRIRVFHQENAGPSCARNFGMNHANGAYINFVDSDDYVEKNYLEHLYRGMNDNGVDVAVSSIRHENEDGIERGLPRRFPEHVAEIEEILRPYCDTFQPYVCCKLYRRNALIRSDGTPIRFQEDIHIGEDLLFWVEVIHRNGRAWISSAQNYHCIFHSASLYNTRDYEKSYEDYLAARRIEAILSDYPSLSKRHAERSVDTAIHALSFDRNDERTEELIAYILEDKHWRTYYFAMLRRHARRNRRIQALLIGIHPKLYKAMRRMHKKLKRK